MFRLGTVADFAVKSGVPSQLFLVDDVRVAVFACFMPSMSNGAGGQFGNSIAAIVPILSKGFRDHRSPKHSEGDQRNEHHCRKPDEMFNILEQRFTSCAKLRGAGLVRSRSAMIFDTGNPSGQR